DVGHACVPIVDVQMVPRVDIADREAHPGRPDEGRGVVVVAREIGGVGRDRAAERGGAGAEPVRIGLVGARLSAQAEQQRGEEQRGGCSSSHQNATPRVVPPARMTPRVSMTGPPLAFSCSRGTRIWSCWNVASASLSPGGPNVTL